MHLNFQPWLEEILKCTPLICLKFKISTMVGENFEIHSSQMPKNVFKLSAMVGENFENYLPKIAKMH